MFRAALAVAIDRKSEPQRKQFIRAAQRFGKNRSRRVDFSLQIG